MCFTAIAGSGARASKAAAQRVARATPGCSPGAGAKVVYRNHHARRAAASNTTRNQISKKPAWPLQRGRFAASLDRIGAVCTRSGRRIGTSSCMTRDTWDPAQYERFRDERARPVLDLLALLRPRPGMHVADLG